MKLIKYLSERYHTNQAQVLTFTDVSFRNGFTAFLEALASEGLIPEDYKRVNKNGSHLWADSCKHGGVTLETSDHPMLTMNHTNTLLITCDRQAMETVHHIMEMHGVSHGDNVSVSDVKLTHEYHEELPPAIWDKDGDSFVIKSDVRDQLLKIAEEFYKFLKLAKLDLDGITVTGSVANFNWTSVSDIDLHLVTDLSKAEKMYGPVIGEYFEAKRRLWNDMHDISIHGFPVELYVQDANETHHSTGVYSLTENKWLVEPRYHEPSVDDTEVKAKLVKLISEIDEVTATCNRADVVERLVDKIIAMRRAGLERSGEFAVENLVFKELRRGGYIEKLMDCKNKAFDRDLSIEDEAWSTLGAQ